MPPDHIQRMAVELVYDEVAPLVDLGALHAISWYEQIVGCIDTLGQVLHNRGALGQRQMAVLQQWDLVPGIELQIVRIHRFAGA